MIAIFSYELTAFPLFAPPPEVGPTESQASLRLMSRFGPAFAGAMVAKRAGIFERQGIHIDIREGTDGDEPFSTVINGTDTFGSARADTFLSARAKGARIVAFAAGLIESQAAFYVLARSNLRTPADFVGRRVGRRPGDDTATVYDALVTKLGLAQSRIEEISVGGDLSSLIHGDVDVWPGHVGDEDYALEQKKIDYSIVDPARYGVDLLGTVYFAAEQTITQRPDLVRRFLSGLIAGWELVYNDYTTSVPIIVSFDSKRLSPDYVRFALDRQRPNLRPLATRYGEYSEHQWRLLQEILVQQRRLDRTANISEAVTYDFLHDVYRKPLSPAD